jgi:hypothetical protein
MLLPLLSSAGRKHKIKSRLRKSDCREMKTEKQQKARVEIVIRNKMHSSCSVNCFWLHLSSAVDDFPPSFSFSPFDPRPKKPHE